MQRGKKARAEVGATKQKVAAEKAAAEKAAADKAAAEKAAAEKRAKQLAEEQAAKEGTAATKVQSRARGRASREELDGLKQIRAEQAARDGAK